MPQKEKLDRLSAMALTVGDLLSVADVIDETLIAAKLSDCMHCIETRVQEVEKTVDPDRRSSSPGR